MIAESSTIAAHLRFASSADIPASVAGRTRCRPKSRAIVATNSTWENFRPRQTRGPSDQGMKLPRGGSMNRKDSDGVVVDSLCGSSQRSGRQVRASVPHVEGWLCKAWTFILMPVLEGTKWVWLFVVRTWVCVPVVLGMKTMEP